MPIVIDSILLHAEFGSNEYQEDAPHFANDRPIWTRIRLKTRRKEKRPVWSLIEKYQIYPVNNLFKLEYRTYQNSGFYIELFLL